MPLPRIKGAFIVAGRQYVLMVHYALFKPIYALLDVELQLRVATRQPRVGIIVICLYSGVQVTQRLKP